MTERITTPFGFASTAAEVVDGITANALMPGGIATELQRHAGGAEYMEEAPVIRRRGEAGLGGVAPYALDAGNAERLWEVSLGLIA